MHRLGMVELGLLLVAGAGFAAPVSASEAAGKNALAQVVSAYEPIQTALAGDSTSRVVEAAAEVAAKATALVPQGSDRPEPSELIAAARAVKGPDLATIREQVKRLSLALAKLVQSQPVEGFGIYFCPMADAYWLQKIGPVRNPYFGKSMLTCGEQVEKVEG